MKKKNTPLLTSLENGLTPANQKKVTFGFLQMYIHTNEYSKERVGTFRSRVRRPCHGWVYYPHGWSIFSKKASLESVGVTFSLAPHPGRIPAVRCLNAGFHHGELVSSRCRKRPTWPSGRTGLDCQNWEYWQLFCMSFTLRQWGAHVIKGLWLNGLRQLQDAAVTLFWSCSPNVTHLCPFSEPFQCLSCLNWHRSYVSAPRFPSKNMQQFASWCFPTLITCTF